MAHVLEERSAEYMHVSLLHRASKDSNDNVELYKKILMGPNDSFDSFDIDCAVAESGDCDPSRSRPTSRNSLAGCPNINSMI